MNIRRFFAPAKNFSSAGILLGPDETRHLRDVLRLRAGDEVSVFDGDGREFLCRVGQINKKNVELKISEETTPPSPESDLDLTLAAAILKGEKFDLVIQKAVELGVTRFVPLQTIRCDVRLKDFEKRMARWSRIALEATKQSGRARLIQILEPSTLDTLIGNSAEENIVLFSERSGEAISTLKMDKKITALIGPEGGWDDSELEAAKSSGVKIVTLGGRILRAETAAISIASILQHRFGDLN